MREFTRVQTVSFVPGSFGSTWRTSWLLIVGGNGVARRGASATAVLGICLARA